jgi:hypothetical protein
LSSEEEERRTVGVISNVLQVERSNDKRKTEGGREDNEARVGQGGRRKRKKDRRMRN